MDSNRTPKKDWQTRFLKALADTACVSRACQRAGIARSAAYSHRLKNAEFAHAWAEVLEVSIELLEAEARRRAMGEVLEPVFYQGKKCGTTRRYSDTLLIFLLKAHKPEKYRDNTRVEVTGNDGAPMQVRHDHISHVPELAAIAAALNDLGLPCPANLASPGAERAAQGG